MKQVLSLLTNGHDLLSIQLIIFLYTPKSFSELHARPRISSAFGFIIWSKKERKNYILLVNFRLSNIYILEEAIFRVCALFVEVLI